MAAPRKSKKADRSNNKTKTPVNNIKNLSLLDIEPMTANQELAFDKFDESQHLILHGSAGTGKTFLALYFALREVTDYRDTGMEEIVIIRSSAQSREQGHLPGTAEEKMAQFEKPYAGLCANLLQRGDAYEIFKKAGKISFESTSFLRGVTYDNTIIIVDEAQNMTFHELDTIVTRVGENTRLIICGDTAQNDLAHKSKREDSGLREMIDLMADIDVDFVDDVKFTSDDIVRSEFVKQYIIAKEKRS